MFSPSARRRRSRDAPGEEIQNATRYPTSSWPSDSKCRGGRALSFHPHHPFRARRRDFPWVSAAHALLHMSMPPGSLSFLTQRLPYFFCFAPLQAILPIFGVFERIRDVPQRWRRDERRLASRWQLQERRQRQHGSTSSSSISLSWPATAAAAGSAAAGVLRRAAAARRKPRPPVRCSHGRVRPTRVARRRSGRIPAPYLMMCIRVEKSCECSLFKRRA